MNSILDTKDKCRRAAGDSPGVIIPASVLKTKELGRLGERIVINCKGAQARPLGGLAALGMSVFDLRYSDRCKIETQSSLICISLMVAWISGVAVV